MKKLVERILNGEMIIITGKNGVEYNILRVMFNIKCCELSIMNLSLSKKCSGYLEAIEEGAIWHEFVEDNAEAVSNFIERLLQN